ncbi:uncharacterized protein [Spinacia oleracea]|uniref:Tc1-like transposase DDE domain-containing protein n=1 Tax=Spinacia oleracea TaxID=3562 RepID=A0ABM3RS21_SPIOL|nr:uncharacterized protein LOC130472032 [Spinacia oleracea]
MKQGELKPHTNPLKPGLTEHNKRARISYCLNFIMPGTHTTNPTYYDMHNVVHIDEKWFYLTKKDQRMLLAPNEVPPHRVVKSKNFIPKIMFMGAVARPRWDREGNCTFDGKLGLFPFTMEVPAKRSSCNRQRGTMETKPINKVNKDVFREMITMKIIPAIMEKWPQDDSDKVIIIQADNAKPHCGADIHEFIQSHNQNGFRFFWAPQPPNSPDLNILDLGFFRSIQSKYEKSMPKNVTVLIKEAGQAFNGTHPKTLSNVCWKMREIYHCAQVTAVVDDVRAATQYLHSPMPMAQVAQIEVEEDEDDWEHEDYAMSLYGYILLCNAINDQSNFWKTLCPKIMPSPIF